MNFLNNLSFDTNIDIDTDILPPNPSGCIHGSCSVLLGDNKTQKLVKHIKKNDLVKTPSGVAKVVCVFKINFQNYNQKMVEFDNGLIITPYHPIKNNNVWTFPCSISPIKDIVCDAVYDFVLDHGHIMIINGIECVTLGHNINDNEIIKHPYFGTNAVINDLQKITGYKSGYISVNPTDLIMKRDNTGIVCGMKII